VANRKDKETPRIRKRILVLDSDDDTDDGNIAYDVETDVEDESNAAEKPQEDVSEGSNFFQGVVFYVQPDSQVENKNPMSHSRKELETIICRHKG